jgi:hypothetical protein
MSGDAAPLLDVFSAGLAVVRRSRASASVGSGRAFRIAWSMHQIRSGPTEDQWHDARARRWCLRPLHESRDPRDDGRVATHARTSSDPEVFVARDGIVSELVVSTLASPALTAPDLLELYLHRGSCETVLAALRQGAREGSLGLPSSPFVRRQQGSSLSGCGNLR